jgi:hypothetical protein
MKVGKMNILKAEEKTVRLGVEENDKATDYSKFVFYGIHTLTFVGRVNNVTDGLSAREREVAVRATLGGPDDPLKIGEYCWMNRGQLRIFAASLQV